MRRYIVIFMLFLCLFGCASKDEFSMLVENVHLQTFNTESAYVNCDLEFKSIDENTNRYRILIHQPMQNLDHVRAFVVCDSSIGKTIPSYGFYENDKCNLYIDKIDLENNYYEGISLIGLTTEKQIVCYVYLSFEVNGQLVEEYIVMEGNIYDAP